MKEGKQMESQLRRARERNLIVHGRFELLQQKYPRDLYWNYW